MLKKVLLLGFCALVCDKVYSQQYTQKDLIGRWHFSNFDWIFVSDSTAMFVEQSGLVKSSAKYITQNTNDGMRLNYTFETTSKKKITIQSTIRFLNDSVFLYKEGHSLPANIDTSKHKVGIYKKIKKQNSATTARLPTWHDLVGDWSNYFKKEVLNNHIIFKDETNATFIFEDGIIEELTYKVDFKKAPITIDFYYKNSPKTLQALVGFENDGIIRIEKFPDNNRPDHFTMFGHNATFVNESLANKLRLKLIKLRF